MLKKLNLPLFSSSLYLTVQLIANILSVKILVLPLAGGAVDGGTIIYPLTFTLRDLVHKTCGKNNARQIIVIAALANCLMFALFWLIGRLPADESWHNQTAYELILLPVGRIVLASIAAQLIAELIDTEIFSLVYKKIGELSAVFFSNLAGLLVDSLIFCSIAFIGTMPAIKVFEIFLANIIIKLVISLFSTPAAKLIPRLVDKKDM